MIGNEIIAEIFKEQIKLGIVGFIPDNNNEEYVQLTYGKPAKMGEVFSHNELMNLPDSNNMIEAYKNGCKTEKEILAYTDAITKKALKKAVETGTYQITDRIGLLHCKDNNVECSWDIVDEVITPEGHRLYVRKHSY